MKLGKAERIMALYDMTKRAFADLDTYNGYKETLDIEAADSIGQNIATTFLVMAHEYFYFCEHGVKDDEKPNGIHNDDASNTSGI